jgi:hypothetical protein
MRGRKKKGTAFGETPEPTPETAHAPRENLFGVRKKKGEKKEEKKRGQSTYLD